MDNQWIEKYRPTKIEDIVQQDDIVRILKNTIKTGELPHLIFYGESGTGKTSTILAIAHQLFGSYINERVMELNASDERGIGIVRDKIILFSKLAINDKPPPFKLVILDEADSMTIDAQACLRQIMEKTASVTRFCFICNYINQIIEPILSRCVKFKFKQVNKYNMINRLKFIAKSENMVLKKENIETIIKFSNGDLRNAIMLLQNLNYITKINKKNVIHNFNRIINCIDEHNIINICKKADIKQIRNEVNRLLNKGYTYTTLLTKIIDELITCNLSDDLKEDLFIKIGKIEKRLSDGGDEYLQLLNIFTLISKKMKG